MAQRQHATYLAPHRFGNRLLNPLSQAAFGADGSGPGTLTAAVVRASDAELAVHYSADVAGRYSLVVRCSSTGEVCAASMQGSLISFGAAVQDLLGPQMAGQPTFPVCYRCAAGICTNLLTKTSLTILIDTAVFCRCSRADPGVADAARSTASLSY